MNPINEKSQILESLNALDQVQSEKVLAYIKNLLHLPQDEASYHKFKREAMKEIRQALGKGRSKLRPSF